MAQLNDWTCEFNGVVVGEPDSPISIAGVDGLLSAPEIRTSDITLVQRNGLWPGRDYMNGRTVTLTLEVYGATREEFTEALNALQAAFQPCTDELPFRFRFPGAAGDQTAYVKARVRRRSAPLDLNFAYRTCNMVVELYATSPFISGDEPRAIPVRSMKREGTEPGYSPVSHFVQYGSFNARPAVEIHGAVSPTLIDDVTGEFFGVNYTGTVRVDSAAQTVTDGVGASIAGLIKPGSVWPEYVPGAHRLRLLSNDEFTQATAAVSWVDRWV
ncbi:hypothetical protein F0344_04750 [Streptomyces finlayi]|uniref:Phage tail protein n=1 Tax=Streptomyces finlayi TaxID=67296 RepID=A0A7G7BF86_9ACTN|nr:hypothetical protein [Streptomyces finlayi]QNE74001.1 hypothetical protein F0344_04750 [Streptomyces finlayi]